MYHIMIVSITNNKCFLLFYYHQICEYNISILKYVCVCWLTNESVQLVVILVYLLSTQWQMAFIDWYLVCDLPGWAVKKSTNYPKKIHSTQKSTKQSLFQVYRSTNTGTISNIQTLHTLEINSNFVLFSVVCWLLQKLWYFWVVCWLFVRCMRTQSQHPTKLAIMTTPRQEY